MGPPHLHRLVASNFRIRQILLSLYCGSSLVAADKIDTPVFRPSPRPPSAGRHCPGLDNVFCSPTLTFCLVSILHMSCAVPFTLLDGSCGLVTLRPCTFSSQACLVSELMYFTDAKSFFLKEWICEIHCTTDCCSAELG